MCRVGIELSTVEVRLDNLKIEADIAVGSRGNPTVTNAFRNLAEASLPFVEAFLVDIVMPDVLCNSFCNLAGANLIPV